MKSKQVIVVRTDLRSVSGQKIRTGKIAAQVAHASLGAFLKCFRKYKTNLKTTVYTTEFGEDSVLESWLNGVFTKICVSVDSEQELLDLYASIPEGIPCALIQDAGLTEFGGVPTYTCIGIGPFDSEEIDKLTGNLKLL